MFPTMDPASLQVTNPYPTRACCHLNSLFHPNSHFQKSFLILCWNLLCGHWNLQIGHSHARIENWTGPGLSPSWWNLSFQVNFGPNACTLACKAAILTGWNPARPLFQRLSEPPLLLHEAIKDTHMALTPSV